MSQPWKRLWFCALLAVGAITASACGETGDPAAGPAGTSNTTRPGARSGPGGAPPTAVADVRLESLRRERADVPDVARDPFRFRQKPPPPPPPRPTATVLPPEDQPPPVPAGPPPPPPIALKFIGVLETPGQASRVAVLSDARGNVFHGREGDIIDGRYRVLKIGVESAELAYLDGRGRQTLRLSGQ